MRTTFRLVASLVLVSIITAVWVFDRPITHTDPNTDDLPDEMALLVRTTEDDKFRIDLRSNEDGTRAQIVLLVKEPLRHPSNIVVVNEPIYKDRIVLGSIHEAKSYRWDIDPYLLGAEYTLVINFRDIIKDRKFKTLLL